MNSACLQTRQLSLRINRKTICRDLNLELRKGEVWGILGANGSGKTTLLHTLGGLYRPDSGEVLLRNDGLHRLPAKLLARSLGILFQDISTSFPQTVWDYCLASRYPHIPFMQNANANDRHIVTQALQTVEMDNMAQSPITHLSGGEKRRLAIAALLAQTPEIYLLDEPTNHLDLRYQIRILDYFRELADTSQAVIMMSLHDANLAQQYCDHVLLLFPDAHVLHGTTADMLTAGNLSRLYQHPVRSLISDKTLYWMPF